MLLPFAASLFPTVVVVRIATTASTSGGAERAYDNVLRLADVQEMGASARQLHGLEATVRAARVYFGPPDPGPPRSEPEKQLALIVVPPELDADPGVPAAGDVWVNTAEGTVKQARYDDAMGTVAVETLATVADIYGTPVVIDGPALEHIGGGSVLMALGGAEDAARAGIQFRVDCTEQE
jgi:hypothetical protein